MKTAHRFSHPPAGFTLVELMVSIFLMLLIMVGVNTVFRTTSESVGGNQAMSAAMRESRAIQATLQQDFASMASDAPAIIIRSEQLFQYATPQDYQSDVTPTVPSSADYTNSGVESAVLATDYSLRSHRQDRIAFFTRQLLRRQTGNDGTFMANQSAYEQWVWYGHLRLPDNTANPAAANFYNPGPFNEDTHATGLIVTLAQNPNNYFANQWALGRQAMLLATPSAGVIKDNAGTSQVYVSGTAGGLSPLSYNTTSSDSAHVLQDSRYDLAGTSIGAYTTTLKAFIAAPTSSWWVDMMNGPTTRFQAVPSITRPMTSSGTALTAPILHVGVSQFMVEYAGDFVSQEDDGSANDGRVGYTAAGVAIPSTASDGGCYFNATTPTLLNPSGRDGKIDFVVQNAGGVNAVRSIRWYGMPRGTASTLIKAISGDVCPLRDTIQAAGGSYAGLVAPIEKTGGSGGNNLLSSGVPAGGYVAAMTGLTGYYYHCAWGPTDTVRPKLYRIVMTLEDPTGKLPAGQTFEYVFAAP